MSDTTILSLVIFLPTFFAAILLLPWLDPKSIKVVTLIGTLVTCGLCFQLAGRYFELRKSPDFASSTLQKRAENAKAPGAGPGNLVVRHPWIAGSGTAAGNFKIEYYLGVDGISLSLVLLTGILSVLSMLAAFSIDKYVRGFCVLFLLLETGMMGVFLALDFFLFYVFWEVMLLPMYFLIGIWGGPRREYAAIKFFLYTLLGSVLILIAILGFFFTSGTNTFDLMELAKLGQDTSPAAKFSQTFQIVMFVLLFIGFAIKIPIVPFHTWLPDAHVEAPTPISMILAGVLLKMGGYGLIRIAYPICPVAAATPQVAFVVATIGVVSIIYGALAAMAQTDFKKLVAYSSVSHMGYVTLGIAVLPVLNSTYYNWGLTGAMFQMLAHGVSSAGMFFLVGVIYERAHHRDLNKFGGLMNAMPLYGGLSIVIFFAGMGLPGLCGFVGEMFTVLAGFKYSPAMGVIAALGVILTAGYILWTVQRVFLGGNTTYQGTLEINTREIITIVPLIVLAILLGVYPNVILSWLSDDVGAVAKQLTDVAKSMNPPTVAGM